MLQLNKSASNKMLHDQSQNVTGTSNKMLHNTTSYKDSYIKKKNIKKKNQFDNYNKNQNEELDDFEEMNMEKNMTKYHGMWDNPELASK